MYSVINIRAIERLGFYIGRLHIQYNYLSLSDLIQSLTNISINNTSNIFKLVIIIIDYN